MIKQKMCDGKNDCPLTETSSGGEDEEGCAEGSGQVDDYDDDGVGGGGGDDVQTLKKKDVNRSRLIQCEDQY